MLIRPWEPNDVDSILEAWYTASKVGHPFLTEEFFHAEMERIRDLHLPNSDTCVLEVDGRVVGFLSLLGNEVGGLFVHAASHGMGYGRALMDHARDLRGTLELAVFEENEVGRRFYRRYGFREVGRSVHEETGRAEIRMRYEDIDPAD